jgi:hypothetical protein
MKKTIITIVNILAFQLIMVGCTSPLFLASFPSRNSFPLGSYSYYENIVTFEVVADSQYVELKTIEVFKVDYEIKYIVSLHSYEIGDTITISYRSSNVLSKKGLNGNILIPNPCNQSIQYHNDWDIDSLSNLRSKRATDVLRTFRDTQIGDVDLILEDGTHLLGQLKNGQPIGIWRLFYPEKEYKNLMVYQVNFDIGLGEFYVPSENGTIERSYFGFSPTNFDKKRKPISAEEYYNKSD